MAGYGPIFTDPYGGRQGPGNAISNHNSVPNPNASVLTAEAASLHATAESAALVAARAEVNALKAENAALKAEIAALKAGGGTAMNPSAGSFIPPPTLWPPQSAPPYGRAPAYGGFNQSPYGGYGGGAGRAPSTLELNKDNRRGPKGANLAVFCIPNTFYDQQVYDLAAEYGNLVFCQVATHRDTGASRGYAFISYEDVESAENAMRGLHNMTVEGRQLRVELAKSDKGERPY